MSFELLQTITAKNATPMATLTYMRPRRKGEVKKGEKPRLLLCVPTSLVISKAKTFILLIGNGENAGTLRLVGQKGSGEGVAAGVKPVELRKTLRFNFGEVPRLGDEIFDSERREITRINDDTYDIKVGALFDQIEPQPKLKSVGR